MAGGNMTKEQIKLSKKHLKRKKKKQIFSLLGPYMKLTLLIKFNSSKGAILEKERLKERLFMTFYLERELLESRLH
jgi:hypothetical protein